jgi:fermentation-respiration switch protein FrsA (DUF1100 family)
MMTVGVVLLLVLLVITFAQRSLIYFPESRLPPPATVGVPAAEPIAFLTEDGLRLEGWFVPPAAARTGQTIIVFNGNAGHRAYRAPLAAALTRAGHAVLLFDYRGYGGNPGLPSEHGLLRDGRAAVEAVASRPDVDPSRIVYFGESIGTGVAVQLAVERPPHALILRSPFTSLVDVGRQHYSFLPVAWLLRDRFDSKAHAGDIRSPLLVIAGTADRIVPYELSEALYDAAPEPKWLVTIEGVDHNDADLLVGRALVASVLEFLKGVRQ